MKPKLLIVGSGGAGKKLGSKKLESHYDMTTLDIDPTCKPDIVADLKKMPVKDGTYEGVVASHILEHIRPRQLMPALSEVYRVLKPGGEFMASVPNLELACEYILRGKTMEPIYVVTSGFPVTALDLIYGGSIFESDHMTHKYGFTRETMARWMNLFDWSFFVIHELRITGEYDRAEIRVYARKKYNGSLDFKHYGSDWDNHESPCGDQFAIRGGLDYVPISRPKSL